MYKTDLSLPTLITERCRELGLSRRELVERSRYENISKGLPRLDQVYSGDLEKTGWLLRGLPTALNVSAETIQQAIDATAEQIATGAETAWRATFEPAAYLLANLGLWTHRWYGEMAQDSAGPAPAGSHIPRASSRRGAKNSYSTILGVDNRIRRELHP
jgi:hypothetical protein